MYCEICQHVSLNSHAITLCAPHTPPHPPSTPTIPVTPSNPPSLCIHNIINSELVLICLQSRSPLPLTLPTQSRSPLPLPLTPPTGTFSLHQARLSQRGDRSYAIFHCQDLPQSSYCVPSPSHLTTAHPSGTVSPSNILLPSLLFPTCP